MAPLPLRIKSAFDHIHPVPAILFRTWGYCEMDKGPLALGMKSAFDLSPKWPKLMPHNYNFSIQESLLISDVKCQNDDFLSSDIKDNILGQNWPRRWVKAIQSRTVEGLAGRLPHFWDARDGFSRLKTVCLRTVVSFWSSSCHFVSCQDSLAKTGSCLVTHPITR